MLTRTQHSPLNRVFRERFWLRRTPRGHLQHSLTNVPHGASSTTPPPSSHLRNTLQPSVPKGNKLYRGTISVRIVKTAPLPRPLWLERPNMDVLDPAAAEETVFLARSHRCGRAKAFKLYVRVRVGADAFVEIEATRYQTDLLREYKCGCRGIAKHTYFIMVNEKRWFIGEVKRRNQRGEE